MKWKGKVNGKDKNGLGSRVFKILFRIDFEEDEEFWNNLLTVVNGARHFSIQILIAAICLVTKNKVFKIFIFHNYLNNI